MDISSSVNFLGSRELSTTRSVYKFSVNKSYHWFNTFFKNVADGLRLCSQTGIDIKKKIYHPDGLYCIWLLCKVWEETMWSSFAEWLKNQRNLI